MRGPSSNVHLEMDDTYLLEVWVSGASQPLRSGLMLTIDSRRGMVSECS